MTQLIISQISCDNDVLFYSFQGEGLLFLFFFLTRFSFPVTVLAIHSDYDRHTQCEDPHIRSIRLVVTCRKGLLFLFRTHLNRCNESTISMQTEFENINFLLLFHVIELLTVEKGIRKGLFPHLGTAL